MACASTPAEPETPQTPLEQPAAENPPDPVEDLPAVTEPSPPVQEPPPASFDPASVTVELKQATFADAKLLIDRLNALIAAKDFEAWTGHLTEEYRSYYSDPQVLAKLSESPILKREGIVLKTLRDYFFNVVYRSRQNARLDDIDFTGADSVIALTISPKGDRLVLYYLERQNDTWKIGIGR
jgi:hypothetical protein